MKNSKSWSIGLLILTVLLLLTAALTTGIIDPFFHYHAPLESLSYPLNNQRYQNDGIGKNFSYDALITGTSLTENFKTSEFDALFGTDSIKVTFSGGSYQEITSNLHRALAANPNIRYVLYGIDEWFLYVGRDLLLADGEYPTYLYDEDPFNDVNYLLNKEILCGNTLDVLSFTRSGQSTTSFDDYSSWDMPTGLPILMDSYARPEKSETAAQYSQALADGLRANLQQNLVSLAHQYPDTQFIYFFPPYSILLWDEHSQNGILEQSIAALKTATEVLLEADNIQVYSFYTDFETAADPDNYRDIAHYHAGINSLILQRIHREEYRLTKENYEAHWQEVLDYYQNFDFDALYAHWQSLL